MFGDTEKATFYPVTQSSVAKWLSKFTFSEDTKCINDLDTFVADSKFEICK